jgi:hypothetical protein
MDRFVLLARWQVVYYNKLKHLAWISLPVVLVLKQTDSSIDQNGRFIGSRKIEYERGL